jgi:hypothetical protein
MLYGPANGRCHSEVEMTFLEWRIGELRFRTSMWRILGSWLAELILCVRLTIK